MIIKNKSGNAIVYSVILSAILFTISISLTTAILGSFTAIGNVTLSNASFYAAEAGIEQGLYDITGHGPGYKPVPVEKVLGNKAELSWNIDSRIYDYTEVKLNPGDTVVLPLYYTYINPTTHIEELFYIEPEWLNYNMYYPIDKETETCKDELGDDIGVDTASLDTLQGDFRITPLSESAGEVKEDDIDFQNQVNVYTVEDLTDFCWVETSPGQSGFTKGDMLYRKLDGTPVQWLNLTHPNGPEDMPGTCESLEPADNMKYAITDFRSSSIPEIDERTFYISGSSTGSPIELGDIRMTSYFDDLGNSSYRDVDYESNDIYQPITDISFKLLVDHINDTDGTYIEVEDNYIYGLIEGNYYVIYPYIDLTTPIGPTYPVDHPADPSDLEYVNNIKSTNVDLSKGFTLYIDRDENTIVNPNVMSRWALIYEDSPGSVTEPEEYVAIRNFATSDFYWHESFECEPNSVGGYFNQINSGAPGNTYNVSNTTIIGTSFEQDHWENTDGLIPKPINPFISITAYQPIFFMFDPDPDIDEVPTDICEVGESGCTEPTPFIPSPFIYLRSTGSAGGSNNYTEQILETRLEQTGTIPIFNQTVVF